MTCAPVFLTPGSTVDAPPRGGDGSSRGDDGIGERDVWLAAGADEGDGPPWPGLAGTATFPRPWAARFGEAPGGAQGGAADAPPPRGAVLLHGWGGTRCGPHRMFARMARALAAGGAVALRVDLSGRGLSDGDPDAVDLDAMIADALAARAWLRARGCGDVSFAGLCSGGNVAVGAAATVAEREPGAAAGMRLALLSTLPFTARTAGMARRKRGRLLAEYARRALRWSTWRRLLRGEISGRGLARTLAAAGAEGGAARRLKDSRRDLPALWAAARVPARFVYGGGDPEAAPAWAHYAAFARGHGIPADAVWVPEANHNFYAAPWSAAAERAAVDFLLSA